MLKIITIFFDQTFLDQQNLTCDCITAGGQSESGKKKQKLNFIFVS